MLILLRGLAFVTTLALNWKDVPLPHTNRIVLMHLRDAVFCEGWYWAALLLHWILSVVQHKSLFLICGKLAVLVDFTQCVCLDLLKCTTLTSSPSSGHVELKTPAGGHTFVAMATFIGVIYFSWEHLMEGTRGAVKNRFSFVSPRSASVTVTESRTATESQNILCGKNKRIWGSILDRVFSGEKLLEATL